MDGHECSELLLSELENCRTFGSEYYSKEFVSIVNKVKSIPHTTLSNASELITDGDHGSPNYQDEGILYLLSECIKPGYIDLSKSRFITEDKHKQLKRSSLHPGNVVVTKTGVNFGISAVIPDDYEECNTIAHVGKIELKSEYNPYVVSSFLNSKYGYYQMRRRGLKATRPEMKLIEMQDILIPVFNSSDLGSALKQTIEQGYDLMRKAENKYMQSEELLLNEIGINMSAITSGGVSVKSFSESFGNTGRLDAEYYQPKYDAFEQHVLNYVDGYTTPAKEFDLIKTKCTRDLDEYPYVEIGDINIGTGSSEYNIVATEDLPANAKIMTRAGDLLVSTVRPYRGAVSILTDNNLLVSGAFTVLREKGTYPTQTLLVLFRTSLYKDWLLKFNVGTSYPVIKDDDVLNIPIPILKEDVHTQIRNYVQESQKLLAKSKQLLECAKQAVEMVIELDESTAISWLEAKTTEFAKY